MSFRNDIENGLKREKIYLKHCKGTYLQLLNNKTIEQRLLLDGISNYKTDDVDNLGNKPHSETRNGLILHCLLPKR